MVIRISVALLALYLVHGSQNAARDGARLAGDIRAEAPAKALTLCLDNAATCKAIMSQVTGQITGQVTSKVTGHVASPEKAPLPAIVPAGPAPSAARPITSEAHFPLPPRRPDHLPGRKKA